MNCLDNSVNILSVCVATSAVVLIFGLLVARSAEVRDVDPLLSFKDSTNC